MNTRILAAAVALSLLMAGCQTEPTTGGVNGTPHPKGDEFGRPGTFMIALVVIALATLAAVAVDRRVGRGRPAPQALRLTRYQPRHARA